MQVRMARTPHAVWDSTSRRHIVNWRFPKELHPLTGSFFRDRFPRNLSPQQAAQREAQKLAEFYSKIDAAKARLATPDGGFDVMQYHLDAAKAGLAHVRGVDFPEIAATFTALDADNERREDETALLRLSLKTGIRVNLPQPAKVVNTEEVIEAWIAERTKNDKRRPKDSAVWNKRSKLSRLLGWKIGRDLPVRLSKPEITEILSIGNIGAITADDWRRYNLKLVKDGTDYDHIADLLPLFKLAKKFAIITKNPMAEAEIELPLKNKGKRPPFSDTEAAAILTKALVKAHREPVLWAHVLAAYTGTINSEILEANASEFYQLPDGPCAGRWVFDMWGRTLKTGFRPRILPLHPAITESGFLVHLQTRAGKPLFDGKPESNSNRLNLWLHDPDGLNQPKTFYSWRHRVLYALDKLTKKGKTTVSLNHFIAGHAGSGIGERFYHHHELPEEFGEIVTAIEGLQ